MLASTISPNTHISSRFSIIRPTEIQPKYSITLPETSEQKQSYLTINAEITESGDYYWSISLFTPNREDSTDVLKRTIQEIRQQLKNGISPSDDQLLQLLNPNSYGRDFAYTAELLINIPEIEGLTLHIADAFIVPFIHGIFYLAKDMPSSKANGKQSTKPTHIEHASSAYSEGAELVHRLVTIFYNVNQTSIDKLKKRFGEKFKILTSSELLSYVNENIQSVDQALEAHSDLREALNNSLSSIKKKYKAIGYEFEDKFYFEFYKREGAFRLGVLKSKHYKGDLYLGENARIITKLHGQFANTHHTNPDTNFRPISILTKSEPPKPDPNKVRKTQSKDSKSKKGNEEKIHLRENSNSKNSSSSVESGDEREMELSSAPSSPPPDPDSSDVECPSDALSGSNLMSYNVEAFSIEVLPMNPNVNQKPSSGEKQPLGAPRPAAADIANLIAESYADLSDDMRPYARGTVKSALQNVFSSAAKRNQERFQFLQNRYPLLKDASYSDELLAALENFEMAKHRDPGLKNATVTSDLLIRFFSAEPGKSAIGASSPQFSGGSQTPPLAVRAGASSASPPITKEVSSSVSLHPRSALTLDTSESAETKGVQPSTSPTHTLLPKLASPRIVPGPEDVSPFSNNSAAYAASSMAKVFSSTAGPADKVNAAIAPPVEAPKDSSSSGLVYNK